MKGNRNNGWAIIETVGILLLIVALIVGLASVLDSINASRSLEQALERSLYDVKLKPITWRFDSNGEVRFELDHAALTRELGRVSGELTNEIRKLSDSPLGIRYFVEVTYARIGIDPVNGELRAESFEFFEPAELKKGDPDPFEHKFRETDPRLEVKKKLVDRYLEGTQHLLAIPTGLFGQEGGHENFLDFGVLIAARAFVTTEQGVASRLLGAVAELYGQQPSDPILFTFKTVPFRGEV